jgi:hypothetical protein
MSLRDELAAGTTATGCRLCTYIDGLEPAAQAEWHEALQLPTKTIGNVAVVASLKRRNVIVDESGVRRHRRNHEHR